MKRSIITLSAAMLAATVIHAAPVTPSLTLLPSSGIVSGTPGTVVGWGFILTYSDPATWVVLNDSSFTGSLTFGHYVDYLTLPGAPFYVAGPSPEAATIVVPWSLAMSPLGLGEFDINPTAALSASITGNIAVDYSIFSQDPNDPNFDPNSFVTSGTLEARADVQVVPEPATVWTPLLVGLVAVFLSWRRLTKARRAIHFHPQPAP